MSKKKATPIKYLNVRKLFRVDVSLKSAELAYCGNAEQAKDLIAKIFPFEVRESLVINVRELKDKSDIPEGYESYSVPFSDKKKNIDLGEIISME